MMLFTKSVSYDSAPDTKAHIENVQHKMKDVIAVLSKRALEHDKSKLESPEKEIFDKYSPKLSQTKYGSDEYKSYLKEMQVALDHHYGENRHHPEHFELGINDMSLTDVIEMFIDWMASCERTEDGDIYKSIEINQKRFGFSDDIKKIFINTANEFNEKKVSE